MSGSDDGSSSPTAPGDVAPAPTSDVPSVSSFRLVAGLDEVVIVPSCAMAEVLAADGWDVSLWGTDDPGMPNVTTKAEYCCICTTAASRRV